MYLVLAAILCRGCLFLENGRLLVCLIGEIVIGIGFVLLIPPFKALNRIKNDTSGNFMSLKSHPPQVYVFHFNGIFLNTAILPLFDQLFM